MCILCLASRWSRRIVTLLPWLIIPLIILWALSQLLPSEFQFEVTSPRLACVGVLLVSLGWYELAMPRLTTWRAKRSAYLKERRRLEVQEAAKWRKEATRLCRNCSAPYRDQKPACGKFVCTFCGHMSRRPVLDVPSSTLVKASSVASPGCEDHSVEAPWVCRIWPKCMKFSMFGAWMVGRGAPFPLCSRWRAEHGWAGKENYRTGDFSIFFLVVRVCCIGLVCLKWLGQKACGGDSGHEEALLLTGGRGGDGDLKEDDGENKKGSRGAEKARRKAEEKRLARLAREQMDADERRQREEVARLVEERRRLRDEKVEAERAAVISAEREMAAAERERLQQDDERRRQEKLKKREVPKDNNKPEDRSQKRECKLKGGSPNPSLNPNPKAVAPSYPATKTIPVIKESVVKFPVKHVKSELGTKMAGSVLKPGRCSSSSRTPRSPAKVHQGVVSPSVWDNSSAAAAAAKPVSEPLQCTKKVAQPHGNSGYSAWKNMRWNVWGKAAPTSPSEVCATSPALPSNFDLQRAACSDYLDQGDWFGGVHARGDTIQRELNNFSDLEADVIIKVNPTNHVAPIGPQQAIHAETFGSSGHLGGKLHSASTMVSEPWANNSDEFSSRRHSNVDLGVLGGEAAAAPASEDGNWKMWEAPQLDQIQLPCIKDSSADPLAWMLPLGLSSEVASPRMGVSSQLLPPNCYPVSSQQPDHYSHSSCPVPLPTRSASLWSEQPSFFSSTTLQQQQRQSGATVGSPITPSRLSMDQSIPSADGLFYDHPPAAALPILQNYTSSLNPGERFTLFSERKFVLDRPLQPDQRSAMERETLELQESKWSVGIPSAADWSTPGATNSKSSDTNYRDFYSAPSAPSLWSINAAG